MCLRSRKDVTLIEEMAVDFTEEANKAFFAGEHYFMQMEDSPENDLFVARRKYRGKWNLYKPNNGANVLRHIFYDRFAKGYNWLYSAVSLLSCKLINSSHSAFYCELSSF